MRDTICSATASDKPLQRGLLGGDGGIFGADHVDAGIRARGGVEQDGAELASTRR